ncbi:hypothetical protein N2152v2_006458 [Parachlorella kessleri]
MSRYTATIVPAALSRWSASRPQRGTTQSSGKPPAQATTRQRQQSRPSTQLTAQQRSWLTIIGVLDVVAYSLFSLAYFSCGAALSTLLLAASAQVLTALSTRFLLKRRLNRGQWLGIETIIAGLALRALPAGGTSVAAAKASSPSAAALHADQWRGVVMILVAACLYTGVGNLYEKLTSGTGVPPPHSEVMWHTSKLGFVLSAVYQLFYTLPRFDTAVRQRMAANQVSLGGLLPLLLAFAAMFNLHMFAQSLVFRSGGAIGVGVVNSVRGAVLTVVTSLLFCIPERPWLCMDARSGLSAAVTTLGGLVWVLSDPKARKPAVAGKKEGRQPNSSGASEKDKEL